MLAGTFGAGVWPSGLDLGLPKLESRLRWPPALKSELLLFPWALCVLLYVQADVFIFCGLIDIQSCRAARYSNFSDRSIIKQFSGCSIFKVFGLLDIQALRVTPYSNFVGCSVFYLVGLVVIQSFRADRYSHLSGCSIFKVFGLLDIQTFPGCRSIFKVFGLLDIQTFRAARHS